MTKSPEEIVLPATGCPEKNVPQFLLNFSGYKHAKKLGHIGKVGSIASSGVQKLSCTISWSRDISKTRLSNI